MTLCAPATAPAAAPTGDFTVSPPVQTIGSAVGVTSTNVTDPDGTAVAVHWDFGDGASADGPSASHPYATRGVKTITMTLSDADNETASASHTVRINAPPVAAFTWGPNVPQIGQAVGFDASSSSDAEGPVTYLWDLGDGASSTSATVSHPYATAGNKTVTLTVTDSDGVSRSVSHTLRVNAPPTAAFTFAVLDRPPATSPEKQPFNIPLANQRVAFAGNSSSDPDGPKTIVRWEWDFNGDGVFDTSLPSASTIASIPVSGIVNVSLRVTDADGATATVTTPIRVDQPPVPGFVFSPTAPVTGQRIEFDSTTTDGDGPGDISSLTWDLNGDGTFTDASGPVVTRVFPTAGIFTVGLLAADSAGVSRLSQQNVSIAIPGTPPPSGTPFQVSVKSNPTGSSGGSSGSASGSGSASHTAASRLPVIGGIRVAIAGRVFVDVTRITRLVVTAPVGAKVTGRCKGKGCPAKSESKRAGKTGAVRLRSFERTLSPGARITVKITKSGVIGKVIQFTIRRGQPPVRRELCLVPGAHRTTKCPSS